MRIKNIRNTYTKSLCMLCLLLMTVSCSNDEKINTLAASIGFGESEITVSENTPVVKLPIAVSGEHNGLIRVSVKLKSNNFNAQQDKDLIITSEELRIPEGVNSVDAEVYLNLGNEEVNENRQMVFEITSSEGALITNATCTLRLKENNPIEGNYRLLGMDAWDKTTSYLPCTISKIEGFEDLYSIDFGFGGAAEMSLTPFDEEGKQYLAVIGRSQNVGTYFLSSYNLTLNVFLVAASENGGNFGYNLNSDLEGIYDYDTRTLTLDAATGCALLGNKDDAYFWLAGFIQGTVSFEKITSGN